MYSIVYNDSQSVKAAYHFGSFVRQKWYFVWIPRRKTNVNKVEIVRHVRRTQENTEVECVLWEL